MGKKRRIMNSNKFKSKNAYLRDALVRTRELSERVEEVAEAVVAPKPKVVKPKATKKAKSTKTSTTRHKTTKTAKAK
tara:strand:+ start:289 stop:519 length:231 start_codon:yes stop_codon:yes gene_type:complete